MSFKKRWGNLSELEVIELSKKAKETMEVDS